MIAELTWSQRALVVREVAPLVARQLMRSVFLYSFSLSTLATIAALVCGVDYRMIIASLAVVLSWHTI
jgi:hypothetical protein